MRAILLSTLSPVRVGLLPETLVAVSAIMLLIDSVLTTGYACLFARLLFAVSAFQFVSIWSCGVSMAIGRWVNALAAICLWITPVIYGFDSMSALVGHGIVFGLMAHYLRERWGVDG